MKKFLSVLLCATFILSVLVFPSSAIKADSSDVKATTASETQGVSDFVTRLYSICLDREPDQAGFKDWTDQLIEGKNTGVGVAYGFIFSPEFQSKNVSNDQYVELMYNCFFGRASDPEGKANWLNAMNAGMSREELFAGFANSIEFFNLSGEYGITAGCHVVGKDYQQMAQINLFVQRFYNIILGRDCDQAGMIDWSTRLAKREISGAEAAYGFIFSDEYRNKNRSDSDFVEDLYNAFMGRQSDPGGKANWLAALRSGATDRDIFNGFTGSQEFIGICNSYGIERGGDVTTGMTSARAGGTTSSPSGATSTPIPTGTGGYRPAVTSTPTPTPISSVVKYDYMSLGTYSGIEFVEGRVNGKPVDENLRTDDDSRVCELSLTLYVSDEVKTRNLYVKYDGDEGYRDIQFNYDQYIPDCENPKAVSGIDYYERPLNPTVPFTGIEGYMFDNGFTKYVLIDLYCAEPGEHTFDIYYKGDLIKTIRCNNTFTEPGNNDFFNAGQANSILQDILQYKPNMTDLEVMSAFYYWIRNHSYADYTSASPTLLGNIMRNRGYVYIYLGSNWSDGDGTEYMDSLNWHSYSHIGIRADYSDEEYYPTNTGHTALITFIDSTHYTWSEVCGSQGKPHGWTNFSKPWTPSEEHVYTVTHDRIEPSSLRYYYNMYDLVLGDYEVDLNTFDPFDCNTWCLDSTEEAIAALKRRVPKYPLLDNRGVMNADQQAAYDELIALGLEYEVDFTIDGNGNVVYLFG